MSVKWPAKITGYFAESIRQFSPPFVISADDRQNLLSSHFPVFSVIERIVYQ